MNYSHTEVGAMLERIGEGLKRHGMAMPAVNATNVTLGDLVAILDCMVTGPTAERPSAFAEPAAVASEQAGGRGAEQGGGEPDPPQAGDQQEAAKGADPGSPVPGQ